MKGIGLGNGRLSAWLLWAGVMLACLGCKKEDRESPAVALSAPVEGFGAIATDLFTISGQANDNQGLSSVTATLYSATTEQVVQSKTVTLTGLRTNFSFEMAAGDRYTPSDDYILRVTALDLAGNLGAAFGRVVVQELPLVYRGAVWAGDVGANSYRIHAVDTAGLVRVGPSGLDQLADLLVDSRNEQVAAVQTTPGWLRAWDMESLDHLFQVDLPVGSGSTTYTGLTMNQNRYYATLAVPSYVRSYRFDGAPVSDFGDALHPGTAIYAARDRIYVGLQGVLGSPLKIDAFDASSNALLATQSLDWPARVIAPVGEDHLLVGGNASGNGQLLVLDRQSMAIQQDLALTEELLGAATAAGRVWVITPSGLYEFYTGTGTLSGLLAAGSYTAIAVDATRDRVYLGGSGVVEVRSGAGALLQTYTGNYGQVRFIDIWYNK